MADVSLYFHIPFCPRKCPYCHFYSTAGDDASYDQFIKSLHREWQRRLPLLQGHRVVSVYFGGGTPSLLGPKRIDTVLGWARKLPAAPDCEVTLEANPEDVSSALMENYRHAGVNRVSLGVQSLSDALLATLGRRHNATKAVDAVDTIAMAGIDNISVDLMYDLPNQTLNDWKETLEGITPLPITHLSLYNLVIEPETPFFRKRHQMQQQMPNSDDSTAMYEIALTKLHNNGFEQYEISALARDGKISRHNIGYWTGRPFLGLGPSAFSYWENTRFRNVANLKEYCRTLEQNRSPIDYTEKLDADAQRRELLTIALRMTQGLNINTFQQQYGPLEKQTQQRLASLAEQGLIILECATVRLTDRGVLFYDTVAAELI